MPKGKIMPKGGQDLTVPSNEMFQCVKVSQGRWKWFLLLFFQAEKADRRQSFASLALRKRYSYLTEPGMSESPNTFTNLCRFLEEETFFLYTH